MSAPGAGGTDKRRVCFQLLVVTGNPASLGSTMPSKPAACVRPRSHPDPCIGLLSARATRGSVQAAQSPHPTVCRCTRDRSYPRFLFLGYNGKDTKGPASGWSQQREGKGSCQVFCFSEHNFYSEITIDSHTIERSPYTFVQVSPVVTNLQNCIICGSPT